MKYTHYPETDLAELGLSLNSVSIIEVDNKMSLKVIWQHLCCLFILEQYSKVLIGHIVLLKLQKVMQKNQYDAIITKNSPSELLGHYLKKKTA